MATKTKVTDVTVKEPKFTKEALAKSKRFLKNSDVVSAILKDGEEYTISEVESMIAKYMKGKVD